jgi:Zn-dependent protease with chaperone function
VAFSLFFLALFFAAGAAAIAGLIAAALWLVSAVPGTLGWTSAALCGLAALSLAGWLWPRRYHVQLDGREVTPGEQPALFEELRQVARAVGEPLPTKILLCGEPNAFVTELEDGFGLWGLLGGQRVMGLGMPLLRALERGELRAILAHELGHFHDAPPSSPWILRARVAMHRTLARLAAARAQVELLALPLALACAPFRLIAMAFLHTSRSASREQERRADEIAVRVAGARAAIRGLQKAHLAEATHAMYLRHEIEPLLARGVVPPIGEGYARYLRSDSAARIDAAWSKILDGRAVDPASTHPPLRERLAAAERALLDEPARASCPELDEDRRPAIELIDDPERYETDPIAASRGCRRVSWDESATAWAAQWREHLAWLEEIGVRIDVLELPRSALELRVLLRKSGELEGPEPDDDRLRDRAARLLGTPVALAALDAGYQLESVPGADFLARRASLAFRPFEEVRNYLAGECTPEQWRSRCRGLGLARATSSEAPAGHPPQVSEGCAGDAGGSLTSARRSS